MFYSLKHADVKLISKLRVFFSPRIPLWMMFKKKLKSAILLLFYIIKTEIYASTTSDFKKEGPKG